MTNHLTGTVTYGSTGIWNMESTSLHQVCICNKNLLVAC